MRFFFSLTETGGKDLERIHQSFDRAVDAAYGKTSFKSEAERVAFLFERYRQLTVPLGLVEKKIRRGRNKE